MMRLKEEILKEYDEEGYLQIDLDRMNLEIQLDIRELLLNMKR